MNWDPDCKVQKCFVSFFLVVFLSFFYDRIRNSRGNARELITNAQFWMNHSKPSNPKCAACGQMRLNETTSFCFCLRCNGISCQIFCSFCFFRKGLMLFAWDCCVDCSLLCQRNHRLHHQLDCVLDLKKDVFGVLQDTLCPFDAFRSKDALILPIFVSRLQKL